MTPRFQLRPMSQADAVAISRWRYPEPYSFYDWDADPDDLAELLDPARRGDAYSAVEDASGRLVGFFSCKPSEPGAVEIGLGLRPDLTGRGLGAAFLEAGSRCGSPPSGCAPARTPSRRARRSRGT